MEEEKAPLINMLIQIGAKRCNLVRHLSFQAMQALYSPSGSLKETLFGASQKHTELWKVSAANDAAGWRSQGTLLKPRISSVPRAALEVLHSRMQSPQVSSCPAHLQCSAGNSELGQPQEDTGLRTFLSVPQCSRVTPSVQVADQL